jgi:adenosylcobinamide kinase/adenosylcobinamide-phosphate guanylyltransferase
MKILFSGGVKSGKSSRALMTARLWNVPVTFIATAAITDDEIKFRVENHQKERAAFGWETIEEQVALGAAAEKAGNSILVDCIPMWVNNLFYYKRENEFHGILKDFIDAIKTKKNCAVVTNETGWGNIPADEMTRKYNLLLAEANREIAQAVDAVELLVCGLAVKVK